MILSLLHIKYYVHILNFNTHTCIFCITDNFPPLIINVSTGTVPDTKEVRASAEKKLLILLSSDKQLASLSQNLCAELEVHIKLKNVRAGSIKIDMLLGDMSRLEYIKELSDKWVLSNVVDSILMTPEFIESCNAEDVVLEVILEEDSYQQVKSLCSEYKLIAAQIKY